MRLKFIIYTKANSDFTPSYAFCACAIKDCFATTLTLRHNGADVKFRPQFAFAYAKANSDSTPSYALKKPP